MKNIPVQSCRRLMFCDRSQALGPDVMVVYNNQQKLTRLCSFQEDFVLLQSPLRNNGNQGQQTIMTYNAR